MILLVLFVCLAVITIIMWTMEPDNNSFKQFVEMIKRIFGGRR